MTKQTEREVLEALFAETYGDDPASVMYLHASGIKKQQKVCDLADDFAAMLDCGAYLEAALMLVPEGRSWNVTDRRATHPGMKVNAQLWYSQPDSTVHGYEATPALALCAAITKAKDAAP